MNASSTTFDPNKVVGMSPQQATQVVQGLGIDLDSIFGNINWKTIIMELGADFIAWVREKLLPKLSASNPTLAVMASAVLNSLESWMRGQLAAPATA